ncbi:hypothetical protein RZS08_09650, partial [Arthrospira platensis SPKY1]|nr:hypothetical protein [Arthrospira platensis SPKY1]
MLDQERIEAFRMEMASWGSRTNVFQAISDTMKTALRCKEEGRIAEHDQILTSLGSALKEWLPLNDGALFKTSLLVSHSHPERLMFKTSTVNSGHRREYITVVKPCGAKEVTAGTIQVHGSPNLREEQGNWCSTIEQAFIRSMSKTFSIER